MSTTLPAVGIDVEVCLGIGHRYGAGLWDSGFWDFNEWSQPDTAMGDWVDVTCQTFDGINLAAGTGADGVVTSWEAATCAMHLIGADFDPRSGPWRGVLGPGLPVRVRWRVTGQPDWLVAFIGQTDDEGFKYDPKTRKADVAATDYTRVFNAFQSVPQPPSGAGESAAARVARIADLLSWPVDRRDIETGGVALQPSTLDENAWSMLLAVADTDLALLWIDRAGDLAFRPEGRVVPQRQMAAIVGCGPIPDGHGVPITPVNILNQQPHITRNIVSVSRKKMDDEPADPPVVTVRDEPSIVRFFPHTYTATDMLHIDDGWSTRVAQTVLMSSAWPSDAPESVELSSRASPPATALLLGLEPSLSIEVTDGAQIWQMEPTGWDVLIQRAEIRGTIQLADVSLWYGGPGWDVQAWDISRWGW